MARRCLSSAFCGGSRSLSRPQWRITCPFGFSGGEKRCQAHEASLCTTTRSTPIAAWQAFTAIRVNYKALKESKGGEVFFDHVCYTIEAFKMSPKRSESKEYSS